MDIRIFKKYELLGEQISEKKKASILRRFERFEKKFPDHPAVETIDVLDILTDRAKAEDICQGKRRILLRHQYGEFRYQLVSNVITKYSFEYNRTHRNDESMSNNLSDFVGFVKEVKMLHLHDETNTWYLDVHVVFNDELTLDPKSVDLLNNIFDCHDLDEIDREYEKNHTMLRPTYDCFILGEISSSKGIH